MANHKEILRQKSLGLTHAQIALSSECGRNTVTRTLQQAQSAGLSWSQARRKKSQQNSTPRRPTARHTRCRTMSTSTRRCRKVVLH